MAEAFNIRDRIVELRRVRGAELVPHPKHFHTHSSEQRSAMRGLLEEIGMVGAIVARELPDGSVQMLDGHMRRDEGLDVELPVLIVDLDDDEADKVLATFDPIGAMAATDASKQAELLAGIEAQNAEVRHLLAALEQESAPEVHDEGARDESTHDPAPEMNLNPHEHYDYLVILCTTTQEWNVLCTRLNLVPTMRRGKLGTSRAMRAGKLLELLAKSDAEKMAERVPGPTERALKETEEAIARQRDEIRALDIPGEPA